MKNEVLLEFAARLELSATPPECEDGGITAQIPNAVARGRREGLREAADGIRMLVDLIG